MPLQIMQNIYLVDLSGIVRSAQCLLNIMFFILFCFAFVFIVFVLVVFLFVIVVIVVVAFLIGIN